MSETPKTCWECLKMEKRIEQMREHISTLQGDSAGRVWKLTPKIQKPKDTISAIKGYAIGEHPITEDIHVREIVMPQAKPRERGAWG